MAKDPDIPQGKHAPIKNTRAADRPKKKLRTRAAEAVQPSQAKHSKKKKPPQGS